MKKIIIYFFCILFSNYLLSQEIIFHELEDPLNNEYEFSSIRIRNNSIFLMSEGCKKLFVLNLETKKEIQTINIKTIEEYPQIESFSLYKNLLFFSDESDNSIYWKNINSKKNAKSLGNVYFKNEKHSTKQGLEGLDINENNNYLYALIEKSSNGKNSYIYCYDIEFKNKEVKLIRDKKRIEIKLPEGQRYSDLSLSSDKKKLYLIRSDKGKYFIDTINLNDEGKLKKSSYDSEKLTSINISKDLNKKWSKGYSNNIEGISVNGNSIFLISDNCMGEEKDCDCETKSDRKTLLVEIKI
jgi:hypothetical protein